MENKAKNRSYDETPLYAANQAIVNVKTEWFVSLDDYLLFSFLNFGKRNGLNSCLYQ